MKTFAILTAAACLAGLSGLAEAATLASPATYASTAQRGAQCVIGNHGTTPIKVDVRIVDEAGNAYSANNTCGSVPPQFICSAFVSQVANNQAVACSATTSGSAAKLRGSLTLYDTQGVPLRTSELR
jgi:hypothetical protein